MTPQRTKSYFISDVHLGARYIGDARAHENRVVSFLRSIERDAKALYLLGDILDYWFEYRTVVPRGYVRFFGQLARMADAGIKIVWFTGNHDIWLFDYLRDEIGIEIVVAKGGIARLIDGTLFYMGHGDMFGRQPTGYRILRSIFHNKVCQKLYSGLHPRWTLPFAHGWSSHSRKGQYKPPTPRLSDRARAAVMEEAARLCAEYPDLRYIVIGHHHVAVDEPVASGCRLIVLGNWISESTYAVFDGSELHLREWAGEN